MLEEN